MIFFTADTHFCHAKIIESCARPFESVDEMNFVMIKNWNSLVTRHDEVYILGDFMYKGSADGANKILAKLNGKKYLIKGNHERYLSKPEFKADAFEWVKDYHVLNFEKIDFVLSHFPMLSWHKSYRGYFIVRRFSCQC